MPGILSLYSERHDLSEDVADETDAVVYDVYGVEMQQTYPETGLTPMADAGITMIRYNGVKWSEVEENPGTYDWSVLAGVGRPILLCAQQWN